MPKAPKTTGKREEWTEKKQSFEPVFKSNYFSLPAWEAYIRSKIKCVVLRLIEIKGD